VLCGSGVQSGAKGTGGSKNARDHQKSQSARRVVCGDEVGAVSKGEVGALIDASHQRIVFPAGREE